jgi:hypothetical protein
MSNIYYRDYRIEIRSCAIPDGWSAQIQIWSFYGGTTRMINGIDLSTHLAFSTVKEAHAHAEQVARQWLDEELPAKERRPPQEQLCSANGRGPATRALDSGLRKLNGKGPFCVAK